MKSALHRARATLANHVPGTEKIPALDEAAQAQPEQCVRAWETADINALLVLLTEDATFSMPPLSSWYQGRETIGGLVSRTVFGGEAAGRRRLLPTRANRQLAFGMYRQAEGQAFLPGRTH